MHDLEERAERVLESVNLEPQAFLNQFDLTQEEIVTLNAPYIRNATLRLNSGHDLFPVLMTLVSSTFATAWLIAYDLSKERYERRD